MLVLHVYDVSELPSWARVDDARFSVWVDAIHYYHNEPFPIITRRLIDIFDEMSVSESNGEVFSSRKLKT